MKTVIIDNITNQPSTNLKLLNTN